MAPNVAARSQQPTSPRAAQLAARQLVICLMAFLTVVDLFATQAVLPALARSYGVTAAAMATAVNASTIGMAASSLLMARFSAAIDRRLGVTLALALLAVPTALLATAPDLPTFAMLRVLQGLCMAAAFSLTLAYLAEETSTEATASAFAAYITGNVASNLFGRLISTSAADFLGLAASFQVFAALNVAGAILAWLALGRVRHMAVAVRRSSAHMSAARRHLADPRLRASFAIGFCILFAFIGTFSYVNFVLVRPPLSLGMMSVGLVYFVFLPSILTTPMAGRLAARFGASATLLTGLGIAAIGLPLLIAASLPAVLAGLALVGIGTFLAQAAATGFVGRTAATDPGAASGLYLAAYFLGGLVGSIVLGQVFDRHGWPATVAGIGAALIVAALLALRLEPRGRERHSRAA